MNKIKQHTTAILLFTRTPQEEAVHKAIFSKNFGKNLQVVSRFINYSKTQAKLSKLPFFTAYSTQQVGKTFGERLANEVEKVFQNGFQQIIIIGNDCLQLTSNLLQETQRKLQTGNAVLGPTQDGGLYLIGLHKKHFHKKRFAQINWETAQTYESFLTYLDKSVKTTQLRFFQDVDHLQELSQLTKVLSSTHTLYTWLIRLFGQLRRLFYRKNQALETQIHYLFCSLRAPPILS